MIDFGSSCFEHEKGEGNMGEPQCPYLSNDTPAVYTYIQSRFYRSPEIILGKEYSMGIDMWSFGCILAEMFTGFPIFPGENEQEQLACIMEIMGVPDRSFLSTCSRKKVFFGESHVVVRDKHALTRRAQMASDSLGLTSIPRASGDDPLPRPSTRCCGPATNSSSTSSPNAWYGIQRNA